MAISNFIPEIWTNEMVMLKETALVGIPLCNTSFKEKSGFNKGDILHILLQADVTEDAYPASANITYQALSDAESQLTVDIDRYFAFEVPDLSKIQSNIEFVGPAVRRGQYQMNKTYDGQVLAQYANATLDSYETGTTAWQLGTAGADTPTLFAAVANQLDGVDAPQEGRFIVGPSNFRQAINLWMGGKATDLGDVTTKNGFVGTILGFDVHISNNCSVVSTTTHGLAGVKQDNMALATQIDGVTAETLRLEGRISDGVRARLCGGVKTYRPGTLVDVNFNTTLIA